MEPSFAAGHDGRVNIPFDLSAVKVVGIDADDTLWHSEDRFQAVHDRYHELLARHVDIDREGLDARMLQAEQANLRLFGYGAKGFTLSLIETAIELTDGRIPARDIATIVDFGKDLLDHPVELLPGVPEAVDRLADAGHRLLLITKGDLWHQESKVAASGLGDNFAGIEVVGEKDPATYRRVLGRNDVHPSMFCMIGNSARSDVLPVLDIGGTAIHVPYHVVWAHEVVDGAETDPRFPTVASLADAADLLT